MVKCYHTWLWPCEIKEGVFLLMNFIIYIYMIDIYLCVIFLAQPICLCFAMIVYAVHVSR